METPSHVLTKYSNDWLTIYDHVLCYDEIKHSIYALTMICTKGQNSVHQR